MKSFLTRAPGLALAVSTLHHLHAHQSVFARARADTCNVHYAGVLLCCVLHSQTDGRGRDGSVRLSVPRRTEASRLCALALCACVCVVAMCLEQYCRYSERLFLRAHDRIPCECASVYVCACKRHFVQWNTQDRSGGNVGERV